MRRSKFDNLGKIFPFLNQVIKSISRLEFDSDEIINQLDIIKVQQAGQKLLSRTLLNEQSFEVEDDGLVEVDYYDYEKLFVALGSKVERVSVTDSIASLFEEFQPNYLVLVREEGCEWNNYYDKVGGEEIYKLEITIFLVNKDFLNTCQDNK